MHLSEGILPMRWAALWYAVALPFVAKAIADVKKQARENPHFKPLLGLMAAAVFIISCMPVPVPTAGTCSHPAGTGISAILIGPIMSIFVTSIALFIQALFLAHGGITTWGADIVSMGVVGSFAAFTAFKILRKFKASLFLSGFAAGLLADWATYTTTSFELASALHGTKPIFSLFWTILIAFIPTQLPLGILEGFLTGGMIVFVAKKRPDILASLGAVKERVKPVIKNRAKFIGILLVSLFLFANGHFAFAQIPPKFALEKSSRLKSLHKNAQTNFGIPRQAPGNPVGISWVDPSGGFCLAKSGITKWGGVDESIVEKIAEEHGRPAWKPFINTDQGDMLLFAFLLAGAAGGFALGFCWRKLFHE